MLDLDTSILITGGTGSFGHAMARRLLKRGIREIRIFSRDELKQDEMRRSFADPRTKFYVGDVRDPSSVDQAMEGVDMVFHAAALKQVPSCEFFPMQAVMTNVTGSSTVVDSAIRHGVRSVVCLSTDKAVTPINAMGMTKALMEKCVQAAARTSRSEATVMSCVRYGNVVYSRGSVIPLFVEQVTSGRPITITDPEMTRFLLLLEEALDLVEFALANARRGDIFVRKAPACTVGDLAKAIMDLFNVSNPIQVLGIRHGEKVFETLATKEELRRSDDLGAYYRIGMDDRDLNYAKYFSEGDTGETAVEDYTSHNTMRLNEPGIERLLMEVPEIRSELQPSGP